jgi:hypothetical protein
MQISVKYLCGQIPQHVVFSVTTLHRVACDRPWDTDIEAILHEIVIACDNGESEEMRK